MDTTWFAGGHALIDGRIVPADVAVAGGRVVEVAPGGSPTSGHAMIDCSGLVIAPGFIDLQCNGANGVDITTEPDRIGDVAAELPRFGVTSFLPTVVTAPAATRAAAIRWGNTDRARAVPPAAASLGLHLEGPMISRDHLGAHDGRFAAGPTALLDEIGSWAASGTVAMVTLAPELPRATEVIERLNAAGIVVSAGHTAMTPADFASRRAQPG